jgi:hypothetical protein
MRKALIIMLLVLGGCVTDHPAIPQRYQLGTPVACADEINPKTVVMIGYSAKHKRAADGNTYLVQWRAVTNSNSNVTNDPVVIAANADLATNAWPKFRMHMDLSVDGGASWSRRIGYGLQTPKSGISSEFVWSPPDDYSLLTTNAKLRIVDLDGRIIRGMTNGAPYDVTTNGVQSAEFAIVGAVVDVPAAGATLYPDTPQTVTWRQVGGGNQADLYWLTPSTNGLIATFSNVVNGLNTRSVQLPVDLPVVAAMRLCIRGVQFPSIIGYSGDLEVQP